MTIICWCLKVGSTGINALPPPPRENRTLHLDDYQGSKYARDQSSFAHGGCCGEEPAMEAPRFFKWEEHTVSATH